MMTTVWSGLAVGGIYALVALGYNVIFLAAGTFNFAQAGLVMLGTFLAHWGLGVAGWPVVAVVLLSMAVATGAAVVVERVAIRPTTSANAHLVTTIGAGMVLAGVADHIWGSDPLEVPGVVSNRSLDVLGGVVTPVELSIVALALALAGLLGLLARRTTIGLAALAVSEDREAATVRGIDARLYSLGGFAVAGAIAGLVGVVVGPKTYAFTGLGAALALKGFVALALGGYGSVFGGVLAGLAVGVAEAQAEYHWDTEYRSLVVFGILLATLLIRPTGLFGARQARTV